jgi:chloramphenicol-sensitive protein RarD
VDDGQEPVVNAARGHSASRRGHWSFVIGRLHAYNSLMSTDVARKEARAGFAYGLGAYLWWGLFPIYVKAIGHVPATVVVAHRVAWSLAFLVALLWIRGAWGELRAGVASRKVLLTLTATAVLIAINWGVFIWAIERKMLLQCSLGYFMTPLMNVVLGVVVLRERLRASQVVGVGLAAAGVAYFAWSIGSLPWVSLALAFSFSFYGLLRKMTSAGPLVGLAVETGLLFPIAIAWIAWTATQGRASFSAGTWGLLSLSGVITMVPLLLFASAARRLPFSVIGFLQYVAPSCQGLLAVFVYGEPFRREQMVTFGLIWLALLIYTVDSFLAMRRRAGQAKVEARGLEPVMDA